MAHEWTHTVYVSAWEVTHGVASSDLVSSDTWGGGCDTWGGSDT